MSVPVLTFFNNKGGVGKTSLVYHLAWMFSELGHTVVAADLDAQANLTAAYLDEDELELIWENPKAPTTIYQAIEPLTQVGDIERPHFKKVTQGLYLIPGDVALASFEDLLSESWPKSLGDPNLYRYFRILTAFWQVAQMTAQQVSADIILIDVGPNLGAINRSALIASDYVAIPLGADLFSLQGLKNLGPTLRSWREGWKKRIDNWTSPAFDLPQGKMRPLGYIVQQHSVRLSRPVKAYDRWVNRMPSIYHEAVLQDSTTAATPSRDEECLSTLKHYRSLIPMGQEARKPIFHLTAADGAIGSHAQAVQEAYKDFKHLAEKLLGRMSKTGKN
ncbi:MAG TPA: AAA family ATPase [Anaerohalosphaeraceae bacterium]|nr:AAA family ATPase [Anaerohalosphaeraceae bacterium]HPB93691.1 AAA family ATPase [Anaerohalosphaeraceae bacterium]HRT24851.1 AAA family ATPase [Anaerohalosphaeraceae bacterium]